MSLPFQGDDHLRNARTNPAPAMTDHDPLCQAYDRGCADERERIAQALRADGFDEAAEVVSRV